MKVKLFNAKQMAPLLVLFSLLPVASLAQTCNQTALIVTPTSRFVDNSDGVVIDTKTNLMWQKCVDGKNGATCENGSVPIYSWQQALQRVENLNTSTGLNGYVDWRLPNAKELLSIMERSCMSPTINLEVFPNVGYDSSDLWSSTPYIANYYADPSYSDNKALVVGFSGLGGITDYAKNALRPIRLVRTMTPNPIIGEN